MTVQAGTNPTPSVTAASGPSPLDAVPDMRATAKWIVAAAAAVGSLLVGAAPLTAVGKIATAADAALAFLGLALVLSGVGLVIWFAAEALVPPVTTLATLATPELAELRARMAGDTRAFFGPFGADADDLRAAATRHARAAAQLASLAAHERKADVKATLELSLADAHANHALAQQLQRRLLEFVHVWQIRESLRRARLVTVGAMVLIALGAVLFLLATAPPTGAARPAPSPSASVRS
ncbi:hypothetical protein GCM10020358_39700 [Amorphoplanes nipponensis]|uniref:Uncharacterized protein n=1 Tax=Actinoplanes nipponensis TaxID=135950 RepID=A0A919MNH9_9ACTN|nr:hypothetical protein [Actinoplanes nipponensis]GIE50992.1 hypothetical protein Ani05nite_45260 [Actinoplanes nipponensis]